MKLMSSLVPRKDGTVLFAFGAATYKFLPAGQGQTVADVDDPEAVRHALATGNFYPASEEDEDAAEALLSNTASPEPEPKKQTRKRAVGSSAE
ncbi:hypothetical protein E8K88_11945 [Lampropedia aestuarii]|uniref:Uncharacterized protein n=1 Tax=Lampropedia aestuarii TaxID=2562762 RepID=A0A4S5BND1_9BURK|nr:hypothetical protein [Lampropedia aestuarii]THJ32405.1 hypothetical protein E8K88_11945 [Lampropedia aestuarii]